MIKVSEEIDLSTHEVLSDVCELVEIYKDEFGDWKHYCRPSINSPETLYSASLDVMRDGINTWFWDNGRFTWSTEDKFWDWQKV